jgi:hypothetical protein
MDFHLISCLYDTRGNICCHRHASEDCASEMDDRGLQGLVRLMGDDDKGIDSELIVPLRRIPRFVSSRGGVFMGERRAY